MSDFIVEIERKARKQHKCRLCGKTIEKDEVYVYSSGVWEGDFFSDKEHKWCNLVLHQFIRKNGYGEYSLDEFHEWLYESQCHKCKHYEDSDCALEKYPIDCRSLVYKWESEDE